MKLVREVKPVQKPREHLPAWVYGSKKTCVGLAKLKNRQTNIWVVCMGPPGRAIKFYINGLKLRFGGFETLVNIGDKVILSPIMNIHRISIPATVIDRTPWDMTVKIDNTEVIKTIMSNDPFYEYQIINQ